MVVIKSNSVAKVPDFQARLFPKIKFITFLHHLTSSSTLFSDLVLENNNNNTAGWGLASNPLTFVGQGIEI